MSRKTQNSSRDTAKDVMLGLQPSGQGPRQPKEGKQVIPPSRPTAPISPMPVRSGSARSPLPPPAVDPHMQQRLADGERNNRALSEELQKIQNQFRLYQQHNDAQLQQEQQARKRLEAMLQQSQGMMSQMGDKLRQGDGTGQQVGSRDVNDVKTEFASLAAKIIHLQQELAHVKQQQDRQANDMIHLNGEVRNRPVVNPNANNSNVQQMESRLRELHGQIMGFRQSIDGEVNERRRVDQTQAENIARLQDYIERQEASKNEILNHLTRQGDSSSAKMNEETRRLNEKIQLITDEVTRNMSEREQRIRDENHQKYLNLEKAIKAELEARLQYEKDVRVFLEERWRSYSHDIDAMKDSQKGDKQKYRDRFQKINEALTILEKHLEHGNKKTDRIVAAEIQSRRLHEKGLMVKMNDIEERLGNYLLSLNRSIEDAAAGKDTKPPPELDTEALRREMDAIAADKNKLSMEGLLKLEEKMQRVELGLYRDKKELQTKLDNVSENDAVKRLQDQLNKVNEMQQNMEKAHESVRDKLERQLPQDLNELSQKLDNYKKQLHDRIDKEEEERYLAVKELQDAVSKLRNRPVRDVGAAAGGGPTVASETVQRDVDECKVAIKKLAESITTVKNVLDRKLNDEIRKRESESEKVQTTIDAFKRGSGSKK